MTTVTARPAYMSNLIAARERGMPITVLASLAMVGAGAWIVKRYAPEASWMYQFFFERSMVQAVLMVAFAIGFVHLCRRLPAYMRERRAFASTSEGDAVTASDTLVSRRRRNIGAAIGQARMRGNLDDYTRSLSEHDAAEIDATYRVPGDIVQVLPLIGFFGTVLGLSIGLYSSYLVDGGTTPQSFAKAIALAFDNTLLGLLLTILLFIAQSVMRKRDEALLLRLDLETAGAINAHLPVARGPVDVDRIATAMRDLAGVMAEHTDELMKTRSVFEHPGEELRMLVEAHTTQVAREVLRELAGQQRQAGEELMRAFTGAVDDLAERVIQTATEAANRVSESWAPLCSHVESIGDGVRSVEPTLRTMQAAIAEHTSQAEQAVLREMSEQTTALRNELRRPRTMTFIEGLVAHSGAGLG